MIKDVEADPAYAPLRAIARAAGYRAVQSTPLVGPDGAILGMLSTHSARRIARVHRNCAGWISMRARRRTSSRAAKRTKLCARAKRSAAVPRTASFAGGHAGRTGRYRFLGRSLVPVHHWKSCPPGLIRRGCAGQPLGLCARPHCAWAESSLFLRRQGVDRYCRSNGPWRKTGRSRPWSWK